MAGPTLLRSSVQRMGASGFYFSFLQSQLIAGGATNDFGIIDLVSANAQTRIALRQISVRGRAAVNTTDLHWGIVIGDLSQTWLAAQPIPPSVGPQAYMPLGAPIQGSNPIAALQGMPGVKSCLWEDSHVPLGTGTSVIFGPDDCVSEVGYAMQFVIFAPPQVTAALAVCDVAIGLVVEGYQPRARSNSTTARVQPVATSTS